MAVFGAPLAHEDDAELAVRTCLRLLGVPAELHRSEGGLHCTVRSGLHPEEAGV